MADHEVVARHSAGRGRLHRDRHSRGALMSGPASRTSLGRHLLCEYHGCDRELLDRPEAIRVELLAAVSRAGATPIQDFVHAFTPHGVTGIIVIAESHFAIHTWPEYGFAAVDLFTCGETVDPWAAFEHLGAALRASSHSVVELRRGLLPSPGGRPLPHKP
jgi:S-adenosylmethionine decarboxylase proenzyme